MYSTCLFCHADLGRNELIEHFPIGRRLAFDAEKGRLWVVCSHCLRWNLTPLEERWEAIEECERVFRQQKLRAQTEHVGLAKTSEGLALVRVGRPLRPEFAAWRYGDVFGRRLRKRIALVAGGVLAAGTGSALSLVTPVPEIVQYGWFPLLGMGIVQGTNLYIAYRDFLRPTYVPRATGRPFTVFGTHIQESEIVSQEDPADWQLNLRHATGGDTLSGNAARRALGILLARINAAGASPGRTRDAADRIAAAGGAEPLMIALAKDSRKRIGDYWVRRARFRREIAVSFNVSRNDPPVDNGSLPKLSALDRLALEMAVHEEEERRFLEVEMRPLEAAWREAEEVARIADDLLTPAAHRDFIARHRKTESR